MRLWLLWSFAAVIGLSRDDWTVSPRAVLKQLPGVTKFSFGDCIHTYVRASFSSRVTCGLWESPLSRWQKVLPVSIFLQVKSVAVHSAGTEASVPGAEVALLLLHRAQHGFSLAYLESSHLKSTRSPFISEWCEDLEFMREKEKERGGKFWGNLFVLQIRCSWFLNYSSFNHKTGTNPQRL